MPALYCVCAWVGGWVGGWVRDGDRKGCVPRQCSRSVRITGNQQSGHLEHRGRCWVW